MSKLVSIFIGVISASSLIAAENWSDICDYSKLPSPKGIDPQVGALGVLPNGNIIAAFHRGEVMVLEDGNWRLWASGLHEPLGMHIESNNSIVVVQRSELTKISDTDTDGVADTYESLCSGWGMSGNYHEFAFGAAKAPDGQFYVALGTASNNGGTRPEIRGEWNDAGGITHAGTKPSWKSGRVKSLPRMYARVPYRGWVIKINPKSGEITPVASGLRTPHGVHVNAAGELYINDNQGDWLGSSKLYKIEQGKFYGHPASLVWTEGWDRGTPSELPAEELDEMRAKSLCFLPQGELANSPTQILTLPENSFGPYGGDLIMGDMNQPRLVRYLPDVVNGQQQGAVMKFMEHPKLGLGNSKLALAADNTIYIGKTHLSWAGGEGIVALKYNMTPHLAIDKIEMIPGGFKVTLNKAIDTKNVGVTAKRYGLHYHKKYGSPKVDETSLKAKSVKVDKRVIEFEFESALTGDQIYDITLTGVKSKALGKLIEPRFFYTAHEVVK
jgi:glucose/arabinose dehydrogenase